MTKQPDISEGTSLHSKYSFEQDISYEVRDNSTLLLHNYEGPAVVDAQGEAYYLKGINITRDAWLLAREQQLAPSREGTNIVWKNSSQRIHAAGMPAIVGGDGAKQWFKNGLRHNLDGPAITDALGASSYWLNGRFIYPEEFEAVKYLGNTLKFEGTSISTDGSIAPSARAVFSMLDYYELIRINSYFVKSGYIQKLSDAIIELSKTQPGCEKYSEYRRDIIYNLASALELADLPYLMKNIDNWTWCSERANKDSPSVTLLAKYTIQQIENIIAAFSFRYVPKPRAQDIGKLDDIVKRSVPEPVQFAPEPAAEPPTPSTEAPQIPQEPAMPPEPVDDEGGAFAILGAAALAGLVTALFLPKKKSIKKSMKKKYIESEVMA